jgi:hypothetical protein
MTTVATGLDRRRKGLVAEARRALYGLMLWVCANEQAAAAEGRAAGLPAPINLNLSFVSQGQSPGQGLDAYRIAVSIDDQRLGAGFNSVARRLRLRQDAIVEQVSDLRDGMGVDIVMPDSGKLHLMLHPKQDDLAHGTRWTLSDPVTREASPHKLWSLGGAVDLVDARQFSADTGRLEHRRSIQAAPQLIVDADRLLGLHGDAVMTVEYSSWKSALGKSREQVLQLRLKWSY